MGWMAEGLSARRSGAVHDNYANDDNIRKRAGLFDYVVASEPQPQLFDLFDWPTDATVLDVGCGNGLWTSIAAQRTEDGPNPKSQECFADTGVTGFGAP
jgi:hypothetical protein